MGLLTGVHKKFNFSSNTRYRGGYSPRRGDSVMIRAKLSEGEYTMGTLLDAKSGLIDRGSGYRSPTFKIFVK